MDNGFKKVLALLWGLTAAQVARAEFSCNGTVAHLGMSRDDNVYASNEYVVWQGCSVSGSAAGVSVDNCKPWYASFMAAQKTDSRIQMFFNNATGSDNGSLCTDIGN